MDAAALSPDGPHRGVDLLLLHCTALGAAVRPAARSRLDQALGPELARLLLFALAPQRRRGSSSP